VSREKKINWRIPYEGKLQSYPVQVDTPDPLPAGGGLCRFGRAPGGVGITEEGTLSVSRCWSCTDT